MNITRYDLTEDVNTGVVDITPVPESMEGRFVTFEDFEKERSQPSLQDFIEHCETVSKITGSSFKDSRAEFFLAMCQQAKAFLNGEVSRGR